MRFFALTLLCISAIQGLKLMFLPGSKIDPQIYDPFLQHLSSQTEMNNLTNSPVLSIPYLPFLKLKEPTVLIGHSFGGFYALLNALRDPENVKACILINSHFNQRMKMPYLTIPLSKVEVPTLTLLTTEDSYLPLDKAMDDVMVKFEEGINNHHFIINIGTHLSVFENSLETEMIVKQMIKFIEAVDSLDMSFYYKKDKAMYQKLNWNFEKTETLTKYPLFLMNRPYLKNILYSELHYSYYKTKNVDFFPILTTEIEKEFDVQVSIQPVKYKIVKTLPDWKMFSQYPYFFSKWYLYKPKAQFVNDVLEIEVLVIPIKEDIVYYKFPSKYSLWKILYLYNSSC
jgi:hypothetical protein